MKLRIIWPGKTKKNYYAEAIHDYADRIQRILPLEIIETREERAADSSRARRIAKESAALSAKRKNAVSVVLDSSGKQLTSEEFAAWLQQQSADIDFLIGGPAGLNVQNPTLTISFGKLTLPHELARVVLLEQIYRALTIVKHIPYHK
jgi:23S rRNA (pseudouridine1915-N3)-methyltransferase